MILSLQRVAVPHGVYDINRDGKATEMPARACFLARDAAVTWAAMQDHVVVSDMWRSPDSSLAAVQSGRGAADPGYSGHNYGLSIDVDVPATMKLLELHVKAELDTWFNAHGWWCWREDHAMPSWKPRPNESWHYNFAARGDVNYKGGNCVAWLEAEIERRYPVPQIRSVLDEQTDLAELGLYGGALDGKRGPLTTHAGARFMRAWDVRRDRYGRTLAFVAAAKRHRKAT